MKNNACYLIIAGLVPLLASCFIGELANRGTLTPPTPYLQEWTKPDTSPEKRRRDSISCGSDLLETVEHPDDIAFRRERVRNEQRPGEYENAAYNRLHDNWQRCMLKKSYRYTGICYDTEIARASPACEGRQLVPLP